jgi:hypothetical protein
MGAHDPFRLHENPKVCTKTLPKVCLPAKEIALLDGTNSDASE